MTYPNLSLTRREFIRDGGFAALGVAIATSLPGTAQASMQPANTTFDLNSTFAGFMQDIGATPADAGGKVTFPGSDPILRSHFRIGSAMAIPAMGAGVGAAGP